MKTYKELFSNKFMPEIDVLIYQWNYQKQDEIKNIQPEFAEIPQRYNP